MKHKKLIEIAGWIIASSGLTWFLLTDGNGNGFVFIATWSVRLVLCLCAVLLVWQLIAGLWDNARNNAY